MEQAFLSLKTVDDDNFSCFKIEKIKRELTY